MTGTSAAPCSTLDRVRRLSLDGTTEERLCKLARLLDEERHFEAVFLAGLYGRERASEDSAPARKANFNPDEARDRQGWWTKDGEGTSAAASIIDVQYRGRFHDVVVDDLLKGLLNDGSTVLKNVRVLGLNGILAIPDGASKPKQFNKPYFIEVKTGIDPPLTVNKRQVYPLICMGGHATSFDPRVGDLGLTAGAPFPPLDILIVYTSGPGQPLNMIDYCKAIGLRG